MKQYALEIVRQKWIPLVIILTLVLVNLCLGIVHSSYQLPVLTDLQTKWSGLRLKAANAGQLDPTALYKQASADLDALKIKIPEKRQFARVLSDLYEAAATSAVEVGTISYKTLKSKDEPLLSYQLSLSVTGGYAAVKSYLSDIQKNPELVVIETVAFSNNDLFIEKVTMELHITVYLREWT